MLLFGMEHTRIQKLLRAEYREFADSVVVESPFAETTRDGRGLRQVALGLTESRLIVAADIFKQNSALVCSSNIDPSIESFELVSIYPLEFVKLSIFRTKRRRTLKARLIDGRARYYELGGMQCRNVVWALWCEHVKRLLIERETGSSLSETTAASSSSASTLYLLSSGREYNVENVKHGNRSVHRIWAHYSGAGDGVTTTSWHRKELYLGPSYNQLAYGYYTPVPIRFAGASLEDIGYELRDLTTTNLVCKKTCSSWPCARSIKSLGPNECVRGGGLCDVLFTREQGNRRPRNSMQRTIVRNEWTSSDDCASPVCNTVSRGATISEHWTTGRLGKRNSCKRRYEGRFEKRKGTSPRKHADNVAPKLSRFGFGVGENCGSGLYLEPWEGDQDHFRHTKPGATRIDPSKLIENGVSVWESWALNDGRSRKRMRHPRRYALATAGHFLRALGPWSVQPGERESVQRKRASSMVGIRKQPTEPELRLPLSRRQLTASISLTSLEPGRSAGTGAPTRGRVILFWTPEYWYRPRAATAAYKELRRHLSVVRDFRIGKERTNGKIYFLRRKKNFIGDDCRDSSSVTTLREKSSSIFNKIFNSKDSERKRGDVNEAETTSQLRRLLRMNLRLTLWDLDSTTIAQQLTLIDRDLFLRIPCREIEIVVFQRSSRNAPNLGAWIAFSHRISCLTASEILSTKKLEMRTRIIARLINAADKCCAMGNFQSCRSILTGLQSPPIYRLKLTWSHLRTHHSMRYATMERLCRMYRNTSTGSYAKAWSRVERRPPAMPYVGDLVERILGYREETSHLTVTRGFVWKNQPCILSHLDSRYSKIEIDSTVDRNRNKLSMKFNQDKVPTDETENTEQAQRSSIKKMLSAALTKIRSSRSYNSSDRARRKEDFFTIRERILARRVCRRWRRFLLTSRIRAENKIKLQNMDSKQKTTLVTTTWLTECQRHARGYDFPSQSLAFEFLLKARYREDKDNFFRSLKLEPPCG